MARPTKKQKIEQMCKVHKSKLLNLVEMNLIAMKAGHVDDQRDYSKLIADELWGIVRKLPMRSDENE